MRNGFCCCLHSCDVKHAGFNGLFETLLRFEIAVLSVLSSVPLKDVLVASSFLMYPGK